MFIRLTPYDTATGRCKEFTDLYININHITDVTVCDTIHSHISLANGKWWNVAENVDEVMIAISAKAGS